MFWYQLMQQLPSFCSSDVGFFVPEIEPAAADLLRVGASDSLETLESIGVPESWRVLFRAEPVVRVTNRFEDWVAPDGRRVGAGCLIARSPIPMTPESFEDWVVASDGRVLLCSNLADESVFFYNSELSAFVVFVAALRAMPYTGEEEVFTLLPELGRRDPNAFGERSAWGELCAEWAYGEPAKDDEIMRVRRAALGS